MRFNLPIAPGLQRRGVWRRRAFTLVELMIAVAIAVVLIYGMNQIFKTTSETVGSGQALGSLNRDARAIPALFNQDFGGAAVSDGGCFLISNQQKFVFRNKSDHVSNGGQPPDKADLLGNGTYNNLNAAFPNFRSHRLDKLAFFARGNYRRQTGGTGANPDYGNYLANMTGSEAWIWYGHLKLPDNSGNFVGTLPGATAAASVNLYGTDNPNNYYASQWVLGRVATLLAEPDATTGQILDSSSNPQWFIARRLPPNDPGPTTLSPLAINSGSSSNATNASSTNWQLESSRFDLAGTSIKGFRQLVLNCMGANWQLGAAYSTTATSTTQTCTWTDGLSYKCVAGHTAAFGNQPWVGNVQTSGTWQLNDWWSRLMMDDSLDARFRCNPFAVPTVNSAVSVSYPPKPLNAATVGVMSPYLAGGCSQFIVEYAGDFITQDGVAANPTYGSILGNVPDGVTDFVVVNPATGDRRIRWYGMPRDTTGDGIVLGWRSGADNNDMPDVVPLRDILSKMNSVALNTLSKGATFEKVVPAAPALANNYDYALAMTAANAPAGGYRYLCAFSPLDLKPTMIRIMVCLEDRANRLPEGRWYEFVYPVSGN